MADTIIKVKDLSVKFNKEIIINNLNVEFNQGETVLIAGRNGAGKTIFLKCLGGSLLPDGGQIHFKKGVNKKYIAIISDKMSLLENYNLAEGIKFHSRIFEINNFNYTLIKKLGLKLDKKIKTLSAGERAIYHLSLLVSQQPKLLLIDEIIHTIDPYIREIFIETLIDLIADLGTTIIMVNHTFTETGKIPERVLIMEEGKFVFDEKREALNRKMKKIVTNGPLNPELPVLFKKDCEIHKEYYIFPFNEQMTKNYKYNFENITMTDISKAFIGGYYDKKRV